MEVLNILRDTFASLMRRHDRTFPVVCLHTISGNYTNNHTKKTLKLQEI